MDDALGHALHLYFIDIQNFLESSLDADDLPNLRIEVLPPFCDLRLLILTLSIGLFFLDDLHTLFSLILEGFLNRPEFLLQKGNNSPGGGFQSIEVVLEKRLFLPAFHND